MSSECVCVCCLTGQGGPYSPEGAALGGYGLDGQAHLGLRTAGKAACGREAWKQHIGAADQSDDYNY